jgi:hypothetical protein
LFFQVYDRSEQPDCPTNAPASPTTPGVITPTTKPQIIDLVASDFQKTYVCIGEQKTIIIPDNYFLFPTDVYYGSASGLECIVKYRFIKKFIFIFKYFVPLYRDDDCRVPAELNCAIQGSCTIELLSDVPACLSSATYYGVEYRFVPC